MLVGAVSRTEAALSYQFSQLPELSECLMVSAGQGGGEGGKEGGCPPPSGQLGSFPRGTAGRGWVSEAGTSPSPRSHLDARPRPLFPGSLQGP